MKKTITLLLMGLIIHSFLFAQSDIYKCYDIHKINVPTCVLNNKILIGDLIYFYDSTMTSKIKSIEVYKGTDIPKNLSNLGKYGVVEINAPYQLETKSIAEIKNWLGINENQVWIAIDGFLLDDDSLLIASEAISEIAIVKNKTRVIGVNIWTLRPENRNGIITTTPSNNGDRIFIR
jgi:hypothetical protein